MAAFRVPHRSALVRWRGTLDGLIPKQHLARFVWQKLQSLDFAVLEEGYRSIYGGPGRPPYHPRLLAALWIYGMTQGLETAADIAEACRIRLDFQWLAGGLAPSDQTLLNFLTLAVKKDGETESEARLKSIWTQLLKAMQEAGHVDLSAIAEDGTKLRVNASPRSFLTAGQIDALIDELETRVAEKLKRIAIAGENSSEWKADLRGLQGRLSRAEHAARELRERLHRDERRGVCSPSDRPTVTGSPSTEEGLPKFTRQAFRHDLERNVVICPADQELRFIGEYSTDNGRRAYRLYGRRNCAGCPLKTRCTEGKGRRIKILLDAAAAPSVSEAPETSSGQDPQATPKPKGAGEGKEKEQQTEKRASVTEPEALMMLATSEKKWQPSYNADLSVTRHGIIVSEFLTNNPTDYHHFEPALKAVVSTLGTPDSWCGDGHYATHANILLADQEGVVLYAPRSQRHADDEALSSSDEPVSSAPSSGAPEPSAERFGRHEFRHDRERDVMICPANQELRLIGVYANESGFGCYQLYGRSDCSDCPLKNRCTHGKGRRIKVPIIDGDGAPTPKPTADSSAGAEQDLGLLVQALETRMEQLGDATRRFRGNTVEPLNAHLRQHGLGRFHVRGLPRCAAVLTLACLAHNLMKWDARRAARALRSAA